MTPVAPQGPHGAQSNTRGVRFGLIHTIRTSPTSATPMAFADNSIKTPKVRGRFRQKSAQADRTIQRDHY
jgi:hypothetical protein